MEQAQKSIETNPSTSNTSNDNDIPVGAKLFAAAFEGRSDDAVRVLEKDPTLLLAGDPIGDTPIHVAVRSGHMDTVSKIIKFMDDNSHHDILFKALREGNERKETPLHLAVESGDIKASVELYTAATSAAFAENDEGVSPFDLAQKAGMDKLVSMMDRGRPQHFLPSDMRMRLERCALSDEDEDEDDCIKLHRAAWNGNADVIKELLEEDIKLMDYQDQRGYNVVHVAAARNNVNVLMQIAKITKISKLKKLSLEKDHDLGQTPLHLATESGHEEAAIYLIEVQPRAAYKYDKSGVSPLFIAVEKGCPKVVRQMTSLSNKDSLLEEAKKATLAHVAVKLQNLETLQALVDGLPELIESTNTKKWKPLSYAAHWGYLGPVSYFLSKFPHAAKIRDADGSLPIHKAVAGGNVSVVKEFLSRCPQTLHDKDANGQNILKVATRYGTRSKDVLSYLKDEKQIDKVLR